MKYIPSPDRRKYHRTVGLRFLAALHLNDSKKDFNSRVDRHESIGKGELGMTPVCYGIEAKNFFNDINSGLASVLKSGYKKSLINFLEERKNEKNRTGGMAGHGGFRAHGTDDGGK